MRSKILPDYCFSGRRLESIDGAVVHYFSAKNVDPDRMFDMHACRNLFKDLNRPRAERELYMLADPWPAERMYASAHLLVGREGEVWKLCEYDRETYHAGASILHGRANCNRWTLGIELIGHQTSGFSKAQYEALRDLLLDLEEKHGIDRDFIAGHDRVRHAAIQAGLTSAKKYDPSGRHDGNGDNFDWFYLGKLMNDVRPNPKGTNSLADLDAVLRADPSGG